MTTTDTRPAVAAPPTTRVPAADAYAALGIPEDEWTEPMRLAVRQRWSGLRTDLKVSDLRALIAAVTVRDVESPGDLAARGFAVAVVEGQGTVTDVAACKREHARQKRNATVNAWRERMQLTAALDAREVKFARMRAGKKQAVAG